MATDGRDEAIIDASVLLNFLKIGRIDLLARHPNYRFVVVDLVKNEVTKRGQQTELEAALTNGDLVPDGPPETIDILELATFAAMGSLKIGNGDKAVIAAAKVRNLVLAMDDEIAWKRASTFCVGIEREDTVSIVVTLIKANILTVEEADAIKADWEANHKFRKKTFSSFAEFLS
jgi:predicted nucleic acid-binding protein